MPQNVIVAQSVGPTQFINRGLRGVIKACRQSQDTFEDWAGVPVNIRQRIARFEPAITEKKPPENALQAVRK